jgi:hypothetical protein
MSVQAQNMVQVGLETVWGTSVAATAKLAGVEAGNPTMTTGVRDEIKRENRASFAPGITAVRLGDGGGFKLGMNVSYEDVAYLLDGLFSVATPAGGPVYTRAWAGPLGTPATPASRTWYWGNAGIVYKLLGGQVSKLSFAQETRGYLTASAELIGKQTAVGAFASLSDRSINYALGQHGLLYIDVEGGTIGTTPIALTSFSWSLDIDPKLIVNEHWGGGALTPDSLYSQDVWDFTLKLSLESNATSDPYISAILSGTTKRQIRIKYTDATRVLQFDMAGMLQVGNIFGNANGINTYDLTMMGLYNAALANYLKVDVSNGVAVLP